MSLSLEIKSPNRSLHTDFPYILFGYLLNKFTTVRSHLLSQEGRNWFSGRKMKKKRNFWSNFHEATGHWFTHFAGLFIRTSRHWVKSLKKIQGSAEEEEEGKGRWRSSTKAAEGARPIIEYVNEPRLSRHWSDSTSTLAVDDFPFVFALANLATYGESVRFVPFARDGASMTRDTAPKQVVAPVHHFYLSKRLFIKLSDTSFVILIRFHDRADFRVLCSWNGLGIFMHLWQV